ncbi:MAG: DNA starvation/stationary phase protection protein, partial [Bacteroidia bacterium]|nr:DNA starvation/stationary phase protection protein [Bacteroidia bacterium]
GKYPSAIDTIKELLKDHETIIIQLRKDIAICADKDIATADFLTGLIEKHETIAWTLRRYLS